ncbi:MAG TPA: hypothetical protein DD473_10910 [Planctomycetaceae bacterium]|nr:hypothetical protein [Planctomycetaceae bacterium]
MNESESKTKSKSLKKDFIILGIIVVLGLLLLPMGNGGRSGHRIRCINNIRNVGTAHMNYASQNEGSLPISYTRDAEGNRLLSWRYSLLPMLDNAALARKIDPQQPWNSPENQQYSEIQIRVFICPDENDLPANGASFFTITGEDTLFPVGSSVKLTQVEEADGAANTLMITEAAEMNVQWLEPRDILFSDVTTKPRDMLGIGPSSHHKNGLNAFYADGHASIISKDVNPKVLRALITWNGGEEVPEGF